MPNSPARASSNGGMSAEYQHVAASPAGIKFSASSTGGTSNHHGGRTRRHRRRGSHSSSVSPSSNPKIRRRTRTTSNICQEEGGGGFFAATRTAMASTSISTGGSPFSRKSFSRRSSKGKSRAASSRRQPKGTPLTTSCDQSRPIALVPSTSPTTSCSSDSSAAAKRDERNTNRSPDIFRAASCQGESPILYKPLSHQNDTKSSPSSPLRSPSSIQKSQADEDMDAEPLRIPWTLEPPPKWYQWEYWQQKFTNKECCLPDDSPQMEPKLYVEAKNTGVLNSSLSPRNGMRKSTPAPYYPPAYSYHNMNHYYHFARHNQHPYNHMQGDPMPYYLYPQAPMMYPYPFPAGSIGTSHHPASYPSPAPLQVYIPSPAQHVRSVSAMSMSSMGSSVPPCVSPDADDNQSLSSIENNSECFWSPQGMPSQPTDAMPTAIMRKVQSQHRRRASSSPCVVAAPHTKPPVPRPRRTLSNFTPTLPANVTPTTAPRTTSPLTTHPRDLSRCFSEASTNTNGSRHRRGGTVCNFSFQSLDQIAGNVRRPDAERNQSVPSEVEDIFCSPESILTTPSSMDDDEDGAPEGYVSPLEEEEWIFQSQSADKKSTASPLGQPEQIDPPKVETTTSPFSRLKDSPAIPNGNSWMWQWIHQKEGLPSVNENEKLEVSSISPVKTPTIMCDESVVRPDEPDVYFPKCQAMEYQWNQECCSSEEPSKNIILSGWAAFCGKGGTFHDATMLEKRNICYLLADTKSHLLWVSSATENGQTYRFESICLKGCHIGVQEISRQRGRAVVVKDGATGDVVCTVLPVCLPDKYSGKGHLEHAPMFPEGDYLPDDQQYTTMHIMFSLDALVKANVHLR